MVIVEVRIDEARQKVDIATKGKATTTPSEYDLGRRLEGVFAQLMQRIIQTAPAKEEA